MDIIQKRYLVQSYIDGMVRKIAHSDDGIERLQLLHQLTPLTMNINFTLRKIEEGSHVHSCKECGYPELAGYEPVTRNALIERQLCFHCNFWFDKYEDYKKNPKKYIIVNNHLFQDGGYQKVLPNATKFLGHAGREFFIELRDKGQLLHTNNLWFGGEIPLTFRAKMPDNADFLSQEEFNAKQNQPDQTRH